MRKNERFMAESFLIFELLKFRREFRDWYGCLSILELSVNSKLTRKIQDIEILLQEMTYEKTDY